MQSAQQRTPWLESTVDPFHVMAHPARRYLVDELASAETTAGELAEMVQHHFGLGWPAVSKHLHLLHDWGFVRVRKEWSNRFYRLDDEAIRRFELRIHGLRSRWIARQGVGYVSAYEPEEAPWPERLAERRPVDADEVIAQIMREEGFDSETGQRLVGRTDEGLTQ